MIAHASTSTGTKRQWNIFFLLLSAWVNIPCKCHPHVLVPRGYTIYIYIC